MTAGHWLELRQKATNIGRPLTCPLCRFRFAYRRLRRAGQTCPHCKVPVGFPAYYRWILYTVYLFVAGLTMYKGYENVGTGWLLLGWPLRWYLESLRRELSSELFPRGSKLMLRAAHG